MFSNKHYLYYSTEELWNFSMEFLRRECDDKATLSKKEMCRFLHYILPRIPRIEFKQNQIVSDDNGKFYRVVDSTHKDDRLGQLPLVIDLQIGNTYSYVEDLFASSALHFNDIVNNKNFVLLTQIAKTINYFQINDVVYDLSEIYVLDDDVAKFIINAEKFISVKKKK